MNVLQLIIAEEINMIFFSLCVVSWGEVEIIFLKEWNYDDGKIQTVWGECCKYITHLSVYL